MAFNLGSLFRNTPQVQIANPQPQQQAPQGQQQQPQGTPGSSMQQKTPGAQGMQQPAQSGNSGQASPLDAMADLWKTDPNAKPNQAQADPFSEPLFQTDPAKIREAASKMDFLSQIPQELMQKAMAGNDPQAFMQVINSVAQNSLATALQLSTATTEQAGSKLGERFNKSLPGRFKDLQIDSATPSRPELSHPAVQPVLKMARQQVKMMNPDYSPEQVNSAAEEYVSTLANALSTNGQSGGGSSSANGNGNSQEMDWSSWVNTMPNSGQ